MSGDLERSEVVRWTQARLDRMPRERKKKIDNNNNNKTIRILGGGGGPRKLVNF